MGEQDFKLRLSKMIRFTVVERIKEDNMDDPPLPAPTRLNIVYLANLDQQPQNAEFGTSLTTRYNSAILVNPFYPQAAELMNWVKDNEETLSTYTQSSSAETASSPLLVSLHDEAVPIANI
nr:uncharacterized protein LOC104104343 isoform X1 [Nicotiana tomentosiformis]